jgi:hypothetical protein
MRTGPAAGTPTGPPQAGELLAALELREEGGVTHPRKTLRFDSKEARDGALASGMEHGVSIGYSRLDELLPGLASR